MGAGLRRTAVADLGIWHRIDQGEIRFTDDIDRRGEGWALSMSWFATVMQCAPAPRRGLLSNATYSRGAACAIEPN